MKRKYYRIHHVNHAQPMKRVKHIHIIWSHVLLAVLALALVVVSILAIIKWVGMGKSKHKVPEDTTPSAIPVLTPDNGEGQADPSAEPTAGPSSGPAAGTVAPVEGVLPSKLGFSSKLMYNGQEISSWQRELSFPSASEYAGAEGILTFAGDNWRSGLSCGSPDVSYESFIKLWSSPVGSLFMSDYTGTGTGWTGQPIIVKWSDEVRNVLGVYDKFKTDPDFTEVIYPTMDGNIYFLDLYSGEQTRQPLNIGVITKGTACLDPRGWPLLYTGQGITSSDADGKTGAWVRVVDLIKNEVVYKFGGKDPFSPRVWQAYDSSPLFSAQADTLVVPGENGVIYFVHMNTSFDAEAGTVSVSPDPLLKYKYTVEEGYSSTDEEGVRWYGFESSCACWGHYLFVGDNGGRLQCVDMNTLEPKYVLDVTDDSDVSVVIEEDKTDGCVYLYTANEVDKQQVSAEGTGISWHRKYNALTGELVWENAHEASLGGSSSNGGTLATPHVGRGEIDDLVIYCMTLAKVDYADAQGQQRTGFGGLMIAYDKHTGREVWRHTQEFGYWSSPAVVYASNGRAYVVQADRGGVITLHRAKDGTALTTIDLGSRIESTPAVFNGYIVVGTRGVGGREQPAAIYCIKLG